MGLLPVQFYSLSPLEFSLYAEGFKNKRLTDFRLNRNIIYMMARLWGKDVPSDPADFWDLGDKEQLSEDEIERLFDELRKKQNG